jgi:hypothetical protein
MDALCEQTNIWDLKWQLDRLPSDIDEVYDQTMARIRTQSRTEAELAEKVPCWITFAHRPLTIGELQQAISIRPRDEEINVEAFTDSSVLVSVCAGLVIIDEKSMFARAVRE